MARTRLRVTVVPGAQRSEVVSGAGDELRIRVAAPPIESKANTELIAFLARRLDVPRAHLDLVRGARSRHKVVAVEGLTEQEALHRLSPPHLDDASRHS